MDGAETTQPICASDSYLCSCRRAAPPTLSRSYDRRQPPAGHEWPQPRRQSRVVERSSLKDTCRRHEDHRCRGFSPTDGDFPVATPPHARGAHTPLHEQVLVGDATGCVILSARNGTHLAPVTSHARPPAFLVFSAHTAQVTLCKPGVCLTLRNAKIDMFQGCMRLAVDKWGTPCHLFVPARTIADPSEHAIQAKHASPAMALSVSCEMVSRRGTAIP